LITLVNHVIPRHRSDFRSSRNLVANRMLSRNAPGIFEVGIPMGVHSSAANDILNGVSDLNFCIRTDEFRSLRTQPDKLGRTSPVMGIIEREESISLWKRDVIEILYVGLITLRVSISLKSPVLYIPSRQLTHNLSHCHAAIRFAQAIIGMSLSYLFSITHFDDF